MKKAIIFDLYDTLIKINVKTKPYLYLLNNSTNVDKGATLNRIVTDNFTAEDLFWYFGTSEFDTINFQNKLDTELSSVDAFSDTYSVLTRLSNKYRLFLLSNLATPYKQPFYDLQLSGYFEKVFFSCDEGDKKPNPSFYKKVVDYSKLDKSEIIMIGDNIVSDYKGAMDCGIDAILKNNELRYVTKDL
jgi:HAD superfamily hydrolase (TIGR01493 family)